MDLIEPFVYDWTSAHKGSISAEHGLGKTTLQFGLRYINLNLF